jgi:hypothetical protein
VAERLLRPGNKGLKLRYLQCVGERAILRALSLLICRNSGTGGGFGLIKVLLGPYLRGGSAGREIVQLKALICYCG